MDNRSQPSRARSKASDEDNSPSYTSPSHSQAAYGRAHTYTGSAPHYNSAARAQTSQTSYSVAYTSIAYGSTQYSHGENQQYRAAPRPHPSSNPAINRVLNDPALEQETDRTDSAFHTHGHNPYAPYTHQPVPESSSSSHGTSRRVTEADLQRHDHQTTTLRNLDSWTREHPRDGPWNSICWVGSPSEYEPFNTRL